MTMLKRVDGSMNFGTDKATDSECNGNSSRIYLKVFVTLNDF